MKTSPHLKFEKDLWKDDFLVAGIDEVGRGSFAGPLVVGGVILRPHLSKTDVKALLSLGINDSKLVNSNKRGLILKLAQKFIIYSVTQYINIDIINEKGIGFANKIGFAKVARTLSQQVDHKLFFLTDAFPILTIPSIIQKHIIRGDQTSITIALASILAKIARDTYMTNLAHEFPNYGFEKHKGYGTLLHRTALQEKGMCTHHRSTFVKRYLTI